MKIAIAIIPGVIKSFSNKLANMTEHLKEALQSNTAIEVEALVDQFVPAAGPLRGELIQLCTVAVNTCQKIGNEDWSGVTARLQRLVTDGTMVLDGKKHGISVYIQWVETEIRDVLDAKA